MLALVDASFETNHIAQNSLMQAMWAASCSAIYRVTISINTDCGITAKVRQRNVSLNRTRVTCTWA